MQRDSSAENACRAAVGIVVRHAASAPRAVVELLREIGQLAFVLVVFAA